MSADAYTDTDAQPDTNTQPDRTPTRHRPRAGAASSEPSDPWRVQGEAPTIGHTEVTFDYRNRTRCPNGCDEYNQKI